MSISGISSMSKPFGEVEDIRASLREAGISVGILPEDGAFMSRSYEPMCANDAEVNHRPAGWQQAACTP